MARMTEDELKAMEEERVAPDHHALLKEVRALQEDLVLAAALQKRTQEWLETFQGVAATQAIRVLTFTKLLKEVTEQLIWCGGSRDFAPGGQAALGWERGPHAVLLKVRRALEEDEIGNLTPPPPMPPKEGNGEG